MSISNGEDGGRRVLSTWYPRLEILGDGCDAWNICVILWEKHLCENAFEGIRRIILGGDPPYFHWNVSQVISGRDFYYYRRFQHTRLAIGLEVHIGFWTSTGGFEIVLSPVEIRGYPSGYIM